MEDYFATTRNGHKLKDMFDPLTNTLDIRSNGLYPSNVLSNLCDNAFTLDGVYCASMEGFLQSLKYPDLDRQKEICSMKGGMAKKHTNDRWKTELVLYWKGKKYDRLGEEYLQLVKRAYSAMFDQCEMFRQALLSTKGISLSHTSGKKDKTQTILTSTELCDILTEIRDNYSKINEAAE